MSTSQDTNTFMAKPWKVLESEAIIAQVHENKASCGPGFKNENVQFLCAKEARQGRSDGKNVDDPIMSREAREELCDRGLKRKEEPIEWVPGERLCPGKMKEWIEVKAPISLSRGEAEELRYNSVKRKKDFHCIEWIRCNQINVAAGLELHMNVFSTVEQKRLVQLVEDYQDKGRNNLLKERTYSEPRKWMRGKGRVTIQFGCSYNYARDNKGNPPGIIHDDVVDPLPDLLRATIRRLVRWNVLPPTCIPDSCIINIYEAGDCIPPHIDHHDFLRPFCTLSLVSECNIVFGSQLKITGPGEFQGPLVIPLPIGSVLVLKGNGADEAKHAIPAVPTKRISITFRKMDPKKLPRGYKHPKDLQVIPRFKMTG